MNFADTVQLLGNLGEFLGSIAVIATLVYLAVQTRGARAEAEAGVFNAVLTSSLSVQTELANHAELWTIANEGGELTAAQSFLFDRLIALRAGEAFHGYRRTMALGTGRQKIHAVNLAIFFSEHPVAFQRWSVIQEREMRARDAAGWQIDTGFNQAVTDAARAMAPVFDDRAT